MAVFVCNLPSRLPQIPTIHVSLLPQKPAKSFCAEENGGVQAVPLREENYSFPKF